MLLVCVLQFTRRTQSDRNHPSLKTSHTDEGGAASPAWLTGINLLSVLFKDIWMYGHRRIWGLNHYHCDWWTSILLPERQIGHSSLFLSGWLVSQWDKIETKIRLKYKPLFSLFELWHFPVGMSVDENRVRALYLLCLSSAWDAWTESSLSSQTERDLWFLRSQTLRNSNS